MAKVLSINNNKLNQLQSAYIDLLRGLSAIVVVFFHYDLFIAKTDGKLFPDLGQEAVMVFFVISGFVIYYVTQKGENTFATFFIKRLARFYSVLIPGIIFISAIYYYVCTSQPNYYASAGLGNMSNFSLQAISSLLFLNYNAFTMSQAFLPGAGVFWSLTCEWWYYMVFGLFFYFPGRLFSFVIIGIIIAFVGSQVLLLFPVWITGVVCCVLWPKLETKKSILLTISILTIIILIALWSSGIRYNFLSTEYLFGKWFHHASYFPYLWIIGFFVGLHIVSFLSWLDGKSIRQSTTNMVALSIIRRISNSSFLLYVIHIPLMVIWQHLFSASLSYIAPIMTIIVCMIIAPPIEGLKRPLYIYLEKSVQLSLILKKYISKA